MLLAILPGEMTEGKSFKVMLSVELKRNKLLSDRMLRLRHLFIHEEQGSKGRINLIIKQWLS